MTGGISVIGAEINNNEAISGSVDLGGFSLIALEMPELWAGTQVTFQCKAERSQTSAESIEDWDNVYDSAGNELTVTVAANRVVTDIPELAPLRFIRIRSGTSTTPVNQSPSKQIRIICKQ